MSGDEEGDPVRILVELLRSLQDLSNEVRDSLIRGLELDRLLIYDFPEPAPVDGREVASAVLRSLGVEPRDLSDPLSELQDAIEGVLNRKTGTRRAEEGGEGRGED